MKLINFLIANIITVFGFSANLNSSGHQHSSLIEQTFNPTNLTQRHVMNGLLLGNGNAQINGHFANVIKFAPTPICNNPSDFGEIYLTDGGFTILYDSSTYVDLNFNSTISSGCILFPSGVLTQPIKFNLTVAKATGRFNDKIGSVLSVELPVVNSLDFNDQEGVSTDMIILEI